MAVEDSGHHISCGNREYVIYGVRGTNIDHSGLESWKMAIANASNSNTVAN